ncbi:MAG TPA: protein-glutamate O-methyltransferase CheR, partial [Nitrospirae bacterium]|nr:protein-glutamate O-methyltransferase CheR [Nitrospirota bacterium]
TTSPYFVHTYFKDMNDGTHRVSDRVRSLVNFNCLNLLDPFKVKLVGKVDVIFCRNVLIYFDKSSRIKVIEHFFDLLNDGGYLLLGHSESLINLSTAFTLKHLKNDLVYQKPVASSKKGKSVKGHSK